MTTSDQGNNLTESIWARRLDPRNWGRYLDLQFWSDRPIRRRINQTCIGYSTEDHWKSFRRVLGARPIRKLCILGVYYARDVAYLASILESLGRSDYHITGIDKFDDSACEDWPDDKKGLSWQEAGFGSAPALARARSNLEELGLDDKVTLLQGLGEEYLDGTDASFDLIYIDTSHDYETTRRSIAAAVPRVAVGGMIGGDDFSDEGAWGVARAVRGCFEQFELDANWIWWAEVSAYRER